MWRRRFAPGLVSGLAILVFVASMLIAETGIRFTRSVGEHGGSGAPTTNAVLNKVATESADVEQTPTSGGNATPFGDVSAGSQSNDPSIASPVPRAMPAPTSAPKRVGIQAGHWQIDDLPDEQANLRGNVGAVVGGIVEWKVNLDIARRVASLLEAEGIVVDIIPATVLPGYQADAFVALHADEDVDEDRAGFKLARASASAIPETDDALLNAIAREYQAATEMVVDPLVPDDMTDYYAFNYRRFDHAIAPTTPAVILEMGFLTNPSDLEILLDSPDVVAGAIARGILRFLGTTGE